MSGRGRDRRGGKAKVSVSREFLKRSAAEAGLDDRHLRVLTDITHPTLFGDFLWHSEGGYWDEQDEQQSQAISQLQQQSKQAKPKMSDAIKPEDPTSSGVSVATGNKSSQSSKRSTGTIYWMNRQRELTTRMQASTHHIRSDGGGSGDPLSLLYPQYAAGSFNPTNSSQTPDRIFLTSLSKLGSDERYFPMELLAPHKLTQQRSSMARSTSSGGNEGDALVRTTTDMGGDIPDAGEENANKTNEEEGEEEEAEQFNIEEEEEGEDYTTNYYNTDDESEGGDGGEPTF
jgi:hypothetical protein